MSNETKAAASRSSNANGGGAAKKQKTGDVQDQVISEFNLLSLTKQKKKLDAQVWNTYLPCRRAMRNRMERNMKNGASDEESEDSEDDDELICNDPELYAWRELKSDFDSFGCEGLEEVDSTLIDQWKQCLHFTIRNVAYDDDSPRHVDVETTFFSPYATPRAVQLSMDFYFRPRSSWMEHHHNIHVKLLSFDPDKKDPKVQTLATYQMDPQRINVKNLNEKKVTQICKHLEIDSENVTLRYILMKMLLLSSYWAESDDFGGYALNRPKLASAVGDESDKKGLAQRYGWLEYNVKIASKKVGPYHDCYDYEVREKGNDEDSDDNPYGDFF